MPNYTLTLGSVESWDISDQPGVENGPARAVEFVGDTTNMWGDGDTATYAIDKSDWLDGTQIRTGYACAPVSELPFAPGVLDPVDDNKVYITWTSWYSGDFPGTNGELESVYVIPVLTKGKAEVYGHNLKPRSMYSWDTDSLRLTTAPQTFTREVISDGGGDAGWKTLIDFLTNTGVYTPGDSIDPDTYYLQMRTKRTLTDWFDENNQSTGSQIAVHVSDVTIHIGGTGPAPIEVDPGVTTMAVTWAEPLGSLSSEVRIGDPITVQGEEPITVSSGTAYTFDSLAPQTQFRVGVRSIMNDGPTAWSEADASTLVPDVVLDPGSEEPIRPGVYFSDGKEWIPLRLSAEWAPYDSLPMPLVPHDYEVNTYLTERGESVILKEQDFKLDADGWLTAPDGLDQYGDPASMWLDFLTLLAPFEWQVECDYEIDPQGTFPEGWGPLSFYLGDFLIDLYADKFNFYFNTLEGNYVHVPDGISYTADPDTGYYDFPLSLPSGRVGLRVNEDRSITVLINDTVMATVFQQDWPQSPTVSYAAAGYAAGRVRNFAWKLHGWNLPETRLLLSAQQSNAEQLAGAARSVNGEYPNANGDVALSSVYKRLAVRRDEYVYPMLDGELHLPGEQFMGEWVAPDLTTYHYLSFETATLTGATWDAAKGYLVPGEELQWPQLPTALLDGLSLANGATYTLRFDKDWTDFRWTGDGVRSGVAIQFGAMQDVGGVPTFVVVDVFNMNMPEPGYANYAPFTIRADMDAFGFSPDTPLSVRVEFPDNSMLTGSQRLTIESKHTGYYAGEVVSYQGQLWEALRQPPEDQGGWFRELPLTAPPSNDGWRQLTSSNQSIGYVEYTLTENTPAIDSLASVTKVTVTEPLEVVFPAVSPGFSGTMHVVGLSNVTWPPGVEVYGATGADDVWVNVVGSDAAWIVLIPSSGAV